MREVSSLLKIVDLGSGESDRETIISFSRSYSSYSSVKSEMRKREDRFEFLGTWVASRRQPNRILPSKQLG